MNCREFTNEFEERKPLTQTATLHLNDCPNCKKMSEQQARVWQMIDALHQVNAPNNFDFRVKARIASARPIDFQPRFLPVLRYVLPLSVIILLFGFITFNTLYFSNGQNEAQTSAVVPPMPLSKGNVSADPATENSSVATTSQPFSGDKLIVTAPSSNIQTTNINREAKFVAVKTPPKPLIKSPLEKTKKVEPGSRDIALTKLAPVLTPIGIPNQEIEPAPKNNALPVLVEQMGQFLGFEIVAENGNCKVKSVRQDSLAARSGIKAGDIIEELDGKKLSDESLRAKTLQVKTLTLMRGSEKIEVTLQK